MLIIEIAFGVVIGLALFNLLRPYWIGIFSGFFLIILLIFMLLIFWLCYIYWNVVSSLLPFAIVLIFVFIFTLYKDKKEAKKTDFLLELNSETQLSYHTNALFDLLEKILKSKFSNLRKSTTIFEYEDDNFSSKIELIKFPFREISKEDFYVTIKNKNNNLNELTLNWKYNSNSIIDNSFHKTKEGYIRYSEFVKSLLIKLDTKFF
jgi:energy-coupling factor transporter transmembrane protein EcfT